MAFIILDYAFPILGLFLIWLWISSLKDEVKKTNQLLAKLLEKKEKE